VGKLRLVGHVVYGSYLLCRIVWFSGITEFTANIPCSQVIRKSKQKIERC
jgi:hypothetical protein